jgi:uncharacterized protein (TIGR03435 family)
MQRILVTVLLFAGLLTAQGPAFETASIKPTPPGGNPAVSWRIGPTPGGGLVAEGLSLKAIISWAYGLQGYQVSGGPSWVDSIDWSIMAKAPEAQKPEDSVQWKDMNPEQLGRYVSVARQRMQALLAERFHLVLKRETKEGRIYALTVGKDGSKMKDSASGGVSANDRSILSQGTTMQFLTTLLGSNLKRPVIDETGLKGNYSFELKWAPDQPASTEPDAPAAESSSSIFAAIEEQLGLRLEPWKAPVEAIVIQSAEKAEN